MARVEISEAVLKATAAAAVPVVGASIQVNVRDGAAATVYTAAMGGTTKPNPLASDSAGRIEGWVEEGSYDLVVSGSGITTYTERFEATAGASLALMLGGGGLGVRCVAPTGVPATDRANIQDAINTAAARGGTGYNVSGSATVQLQHGHYKVASGFDITGLNKLNIVGAGMLVTMLELTGTGHLFFGTGTLASPDAQVRIAHMGMWGNATSGNGIDLTYFNPELRLEHLFISQFADGIKLSNCWEARLDTIFADTNRGWGINFNRENNSTTTTGVRSSNNGVGGIRIADGFQGPVVGGNVVSNPIGLLVENSASAGTGVHAFQTGAKIVGLVVEGDSDQTEGIKIVSAVATKVKSSQLVGVSVINGAGTLVSLAGCDGVAAELHTKGSGATVNHVVLGATSQNVRIDHQWEQAAAETVWTDSGTGNTREDKDGASKLKTYGNLDVNLGKGDANPQVSIARDGTAGVGGTIFFGQGGASGTEFEIARRGGIGLRSTGKWMAVGGIGVGNSLAASTPGTVVRKMEVFDAAGASLGFVPIYGSIT